MAAPHPIRVVKRPLPPEALAKYIDRPFPGMVKFVVDVDRRIVAVGGALHADAEAILLEGGSRQASLWGGNYYPGRGEALCIEYTSMINIRPAVGNRSMTVQDAIIREKMRALVLSLVGRGQSLP